MAINIVDLNSHGELEKYMYGGDCSISYFNKDTLKCAPFTQTPVMMTKTNGTPNFNYNWSVVIKKEGDYLLNSWICIELPEVTLNPTNTFGEHGRIRWTENVLHNLIEECTIVFNDTVINRLDNFSLDMLSEFNIPEDKYKGYMKMIGNIPELIHPSTTLPATKLFLPLPLFFTKDSGTAVPLTALPHTEIKVNFKFRNWENLLIFENSKSVSNIFVPEAGKDISLPKIAYAKMFCTYATVSDEEKSKIGVKNKTVIIEQIQTSPRQMIVDREFNMSLLFNQSVKTLYFAVRNATYKNVWSNYSYGNSKFSSTGIFENPKSTEAVDSVSLLYNNRPKVDDMFITYFKSIVPWYTSERIPNKPGYYMYSFALNQKSSDPVGSSALCRIDNPSIKIKMSQNAMNAISENESFELIVIAISYNVIKISEGVVSFPTI